MKSVLESFRDAMQAEGIGYQGEIHADDRLRRITVDGDKPGSDNGWYRLCFEPVPRGWFGCWKRGISEKWDGNEGRSLTATERQALQAKAEAEERRREEEHAKAARLANETWTHAEAADSEHAYLLKKRVKPDGLRQYGEALLVPLRDRHGKLWSLQSIYPNGDKCFLVGGRVKGCFFALGELPSSGASGSKVILAEGFATASTLHAASGLPVVAAMNAGNLAEVAKTLRTRLPETDLVIAADNDAYTPTGNTGVTKATGAAREVSGKLVVPDFTGCDQSSKPTDFNDLAALAGIQTVEFQIQMAWNGAVERETAQERLVRLGKLSPLEYELCRNHEAKIAGLRKSVLDHEVSKHREQAPEVQSGQGVALKFDDPQPWSEPVDGGHLLDQLAATYARHIILPKGAADLLAVWTLSTYGFQCFEYSPLLFITAPERECGKSRVRDVAALVVHRPLSADSATPAFLFRAIELHRPTLFLDEFDNADLEARRELLAIMNGGYHRNGSVGRVVGEDHEPRTFSTYCPKLLVSIGNPLPDATRSRTITITMRRKLPGEQVTSLRGANFLDLRCMCRRWIEDHEAVLREARPTPIDTMSDRQRDVTEPLLAIGDAVGPGWAARIREAVHALSSSASSESANHSTLLLADIREAFGAEDRIATVDLLAKLNTLTERPWPTFCRGHQLNARRLANLLSPYGIASRTVRMSEGSTPKGFHRDQFLDAFERYLRGISDPTRHNATTIANIGDSTSFESATLFPCGGTENAVSANNDGRCGVVAVSKRGDLETPKESLPNEEDWK